MREYLTEALILDKKELNEADLTIDLYTKELGKIRAKAVSARKITSKLAAHLEPLTFSLVRLTEKNGFVVADALTRNRLLHLRKPAVHFAKNLKFILAVNRLIFPGEPDQKLWFWLKKSFIGGKIFYPHFLKILGYDPKAAECQKCCSKFVKYFLLNDQVFLCRQCGFQIKNFVENLEL